MLRRSQNDLVQKRNKLLFGLTGTILFIDQAGAGCLVPRTKAKADKENKILKKNGKLKNTVKLNQYHCESL